MEVLEFPPPEIAPELFISVLEVLPAATLVSDHVIWLTEEGWVVYWESPHPPENPFLPILDRSGNDLDKRDWFPVLMSLVCALVAIQLSIAADRAMKSLGCSIDDIADILKADPFKHVLALLGSAVCTAMCNPKPPLFELALNTARYNAQKAIEAAFPEARRKKAQRLASDKTNQPYREASARCVQLAKEIWENKPVKINALCEAIHKTLRRNIDPCPTPATIKDYLKAAEQEGLLSIPPEARKGGRPRKNEN